MSIASRFAARGSTVSSEVSRPKRRRKKIEEQGITETAEVTATSYFRTSRGMPRLTPDDIRSRPFSLLESRAVTAQKAGIPQKLIKRTLRRLKPPRSPRPLAWSEFSCWWGSGGEVETSEAAGPVPPVHVTVLPPDLTSQRFFGPTGTIAGGAHNRTFLLCAFVLLPALLGC